MDEKRIITTLEAFDSSLADTIEEIPLPSGDELHFRVIPLNELTVQALEAIEQRIARELRAEYSQAAENGDIPLRLLELTEDLRENLSRLQRVELVELWKRSWDVFTEKDVEPDRTSWDDDTYRKELYHLLVADILGNIEASVMENLMPESVFDIGQMKDLKDLPPDEAFQRVSETVAREANMRRGILRSLSKEQLHRRLCLAAAAQPALGEARKRRNIIALYLVTRTVEDRTKPSIDLSTYGIKSNQDALRNAKKVYDSIVDKYQGNVDFLTKLAERVIYETGVLSQEQLNVLNEAAEDPFRSRGVRISEAAGDDSGVGNEHLGGASPNNVPGKESVVLASSTGVATESTRDGGTEAS